jgi:hypothetical protein
MSASTLQRLFTLQTKTCKWTADVPLIDRINGDVKEQKSYLFAKFHRNPFRAVQEIRRGEYFAALFVEIRQQIRMVEEERLEDKSLKENTNEKEIFPQRENAHDRSCPVNTTKDCHDWKFFVHVKSCCESS